jgi:hypothetical protein
MTDATLMNVFDSRNKLKIKFACLFLRQSCVSNNEIKKLSAVTIFHDHVKFLVGLNNFIKLDHIWMSNFFQNLDFSCYSLNIFLILDLVFF